MAPSRCKSLRRPLALLISCLSLSVAQAAVGIDELSDLGARIQYAAYEGDFDTLEQMVLELKGAEARAPLDRLLHYYAAYAAYRAAEVAPPGGADDGEYLSLCEAEALEAAAIDESFADALALAGACAALEAARSVTAVLSGRRAVRYLQQAANLEPRNPRVALLQAVSLLRRPSLTEAWGSPSDLLLRAESLFQMAPVERRGEPDWGEAETRALLAELAMAQGERLAARDAAEQSLMVAPDYRRAQAVIRELSASTR